MTDADRIQQLEQEVAQLRVKLETIDETAAVLRVALQGLLAGSEIAARREATREKRLLPLYSLLATRTRRIEEFLFTPEQAIEAHQYWCQALKQIGIEPDPLRLDPK